MPIAEFLNQKLCACSYLIESQIWHSKRIMKNPLEVWVYIHYKSKESAE